MGIFLKFAAAFGIKKADQVGQSLVQMLVEFDPETAIEAELKMIEGGLDTIVGQTAEARRDFDREQREANEIEHLYKNRLAAAEKLQTQLESATGDDKVEIEAALFELLGQLEEMKPDVEREIQEAAEAKAFLEELEALAKETAAKLKTAKRQLDQAMNTMEKAKVEKQRAKLREERAIERAKLRTGPSAINVALAAMQKATENTRTEAAAADLKAKLLAPAEGSGKTNSRIAAAMAEVSGDVKTTGSISDRLAALKKQPVGAA